MSKRFCRFKKYPENVANKKYKVLTLIGSGSFGRIYLGKNVETNQMVAIKMESNTMKESHLLMENKVYRILKNTTGIPNAYYFGNQGKHRVLILDLLGPSLKSLLKICEGRFSLKTILMLFHQMLERIEHLHSRSYVHRDLKPSNFLIGFGSQSQTLFLVDFGLAKLYCNPSTQEHIVNECKEFAGTLVYASINSIKNMTQTRCDDLESIGYMLIRFYRGKLPWSDLAACKSLQKYEKVTERKLSIPIDELCEELPEEFSYYIRYCRSLTSEEEPNYNFLRTLFSILFYKKLKYTFDCDYDWVKRDEPEKYYKKLVTKLSHAWVPSQKNRKNKLTQRN